LCFASWQWKSTGEPRGVSLSVTQNLATWVKTIHFSIAILRQEADARADDFFESGLVREEWAIWVRAILF
jgi:hypothetical protein